MKTFAKLALGALMVAGAATATTAALTSPGRSAGLGGNRLWLPGAIMGPFRGARFSGPAYYDPYYYGYPALILTRLYTAVDLLGVAITGVAEARIIKRRLAWPRPTGVKR